MRATCLALLRHYAGRSERPLRELHAPRKYRPVALDILGEYTQMVAAGPDARLDLDELFAEILRVATSNEAAVARLRIESYSTDEIAERLGVTDRSVRRYLRALRERVRLAGILDPASALVAWPMGESGKQTEEGLTKAA